MEPKQEEAKGSADVVRAQKAGVYVWGLGKGSYLGNRSEESVLTPLRVATPANATKYVAVSSGGFYNCAIDENGKLYTWGTGKYGKLGHGDEETAPIPKSVALHVSVMAVACGDWHTIILDTQGAPWGTGYNKHGELSLGDKHNRNTFERAKSSANGEIETTFSKISAGAGFSLFLSAEGHLYSSGKSGKNGRGTKSGDQLLLSKIPSLKEETVTEICAGYTHAGCVTEDGRLFMWGSNENYELGIGKKSTENPTPVEVNGSFDDRVASLSCTRGVKYQHSACITAAGSLYTWGSGYKGKLGHQENWSHEDPADEKIPRKVQALEGTRVVKVASGGIYTTVLTEDDCLRSFGCGSDGRLGHPECKGHRYLYKEGIPRMIETLQDLKVVDVSCSYYHTVCCCDVRGD